MQQNTLFKIDYWNISVSNFKTKKKQIVDLLNEYPETKNDIQLFYTNKQSNRDKLSEKFSLLLEEI